MPRGNISRTLVGVEDGNNLGVRRGAAATQRCTTDSRCTESLEAAQEFMEQLVVVLLLAARMRLGLFGKEEGAHRHSTVRIS